jgi:hypothetical protein
LVLNTKTQQKGVIIDDLPGMLSVCHPDQVLVVYEGTNTGEATDYKDLAITGTEEAVADDRKCGVFNGTDCCRFLTIGADGPECERFGASRHSLIFHERTAQRNPVEPYPLCQKF